MKNVLRWVGLFGETAVRTTDVEGSRERFNIIELALFTGVISFIYTERPKYWEWIQPVKIQRIGTKWKQKKRSTTFLIHECRWKLNNL